MMILDNQGRQAGGQAGWLSQATQLSEHKADTGLQTEGPRCEHTGWWAGDAVTTPVRSVMH